ncbi:hypothetical protein, partial [Streptomyces alkaliterrae]|uniref:hypothetical protein n=1 Tax=Streptomyces alkaliterrae TaxID=2213162 RepID=UPI001E659D34
LPSDSLPGFLRALPFGVSDSIRLFSVPFPARIRNPIPLSAGPPSGVITTLEDFPPDSKSSR